MATIHKEQNNGTQEQVKTSEPSEPADLPPPYVDPILVPNLRPPTSSHDNAFTGPPGSRGKPAEDSTKVATVDNDGEIDSGDQVKGKEDKVKEAGVGKDDGFVGVFRME